MKFFRGNSITGGVNPLIIWIFIMAGQACTYSVLAGGKRAIFVDGFWWREGAGLGGNGKSGAVLQKWAIHRCKCIYHTTSAAMADHRQKDGSADFWQLMCVCVCACLCVRVRWQEDNIRHERIFSIVCWCQCKILHSTFSPFFVSFRFVSPLHLGLQINWKFSYVQLCACAIRVRLSVWLCVCVSAHVGHINACFTIAHAPQFLAGPTFWGQLYLMILAIMHLKHSQFYCQPNGQDNARITTKWERVCVWISGLTFGWAAKKLR